MEEEILIRPGDRVPIRFQPDKFVQASIKYPEDQQYIASNRARIRSVIKTNEIKLEEKSVNELYYGDGTVTDKTIKLNQTWGKNRIVGREVEQLELHFGLSDQENQYFQKLSGKQMHEVNKVALAVKLDSQLRPVLSIIPVYDVSMSRDVIVQSRFS